MAESAPSQSLTGLPEEIAQQWARTRLAHEAVMLQDTAETLRIDRERVKAHQREFLGPSWSDPQGGEVIHIGDVNQAAPLPVATALPVAQPVTASKIGTLAKLAIGAGLLATGAGIVPGLSMIASAIKDRATQQPATPAPVTPAEPAKPNFYGLKVLPPQ